MLRIFAGGKAIGAEISPWMLVTGFSLALFLASAKRLQELSLQGSQTRKVLENYTINLLKNYVQISAAGALIFYSLFVISVRPGLALSVPFVIFGLFRYWYLVETKKIGESPAEALLKDKILSITVFFWGIICIWNLLEEAKKY